jgi:hypothetical protein
VLLLAGAVLKWLGATPLAGASACLLQAHPMLPELFLQQPDRLYLTYSKLRKVAPQRGEAATTALQQEDASVPMSYTQRRG